MKLRLETAIDVETVVDMLLGLDMRKLLGEASSNAVSSDPTVRTEKTTTPLVAPLKLNVKGVTGIGGGPFGPRRLTGICYDLSDRLLPLQEHLLQVFACCKNMESPSYKGQSERSAVCVDLDSPSPHRSFPAPKLMDAEYLKGKKRRADSNRIAKNEPTPRYNVGGLIEKYMNEVWAKDIVLERLSLCLNARQSEFQGKDNKRLVHEEYENVAFISLPQES